MKRNLLIAVLALFCFQSFTAIAQKPHNLTNQHLNLLTRYYDLSIQDIAGAVLSHKHISRTSGVYHFYYNQSYQGIQIHQAVADIHILPDGKVLSHHSSFIKNPGQLITGSPNPSITAPQAIGFAANHLGYSGTGLLQVIEESPTASDRYVLYSGGEISNENIPARLIYQKTENGSLRLAWDLSIDDKSSDDWWSMRIDAHSGEVLHKNSWTVHCQLDAPCKTHTIGSAHNNCAEEYTPTTTTPINMVGSYRVYAMPVESPNHGGRSLEANPDDATASPYGWHDTNGSTGAEYTITRGNNVHAYDDENNNNTPGYAPDGGAALVFDYPINTTYSQANQSEDAAITNLFYWSNICHDLWYQYGFDEASGNFQENNYGNGGSDSDYCRSEAQDGSGTCNANMSTPPDGSRPRMQMYVCNDRDGDLDNGVIVHEYGHGISIRLTGGAGNSGCLNNDEQMGEGWSDWFGMVMTIEPGDAGTDSRGMGTWLFGQSANGPGIRPHPYSTDLAINPHTYDDIKNEVAPHGVGSVWCAMLWELTWALIDEYGYDTDFYGGSGGNNIAMALVTEGLKLQPCSPGFVDGRDAILAADAALYGGANECLIWEAFAKRGLGFSANQGSSASKNDGTEAFDLPPACLYPALSFVISNIDTQEGAAPENAAAPGDCRPYTDYEIKVVLSSDPSTPADVSIVASGTADSYDFDLINADMSFPVGGEQIATLRIYNDASIEPDEDIQLDLVINNAGATDADLGAITTLTVSLRNNDFAPGAPSPYEVDNAGFESNTDGYTSTNPSGGDVFERGTSADATSAYWTVPAPLDGSTYLFYANDDACNCTMNDVTLLSPVLDLTNITSAELKYDVFFEGRTYSGNTESAELLISTDAGSTFTSLGAISGVLSIWREETVNLSAYDGMNNIVIAFHYDDGGGWLYGIAVDHVRINGLLNSSPAISTTLNVFDEQDVPPNAEVYFYDSNGDLIAGITNGSTDLGCVQVDIDRAGTGTTTFWDNFIDHNLADKTFLFTPELNLPTADYTVTLYYAQPEVSAWETETSKQWDLNAKVVKHPTAISEVTPENPYPNGPGSIEQNVDMAGAASFSNAYYISATFNTGFSGMGVGDPGSAPLPVDLLYFGGQHISGKGNLLEWTTASEVNNDFFDLEFSLDGRSFESIATISGKGNSDIMNEYTYLHEVSKAGTYYYRLRQVDFDGRFEHSSIIVIDMGGSASEVQVYPNPTTEGVYLYTDKTVSALVLYDGSGKKIFERAISIKKGEAYYLDVEGLAKGVYYGELKGTGQQMWRFSFVRE